MNELYINNIYVPKPKHSVLSHSNKQSSFHMMTWTYVVVSQDKIFLCDETQTFYRISVKYFFSHHPVCTYHQAPHRADHHNSSAAVNESYWLTQKYMSSLQRKKIIDIKYFQILSPGENIYEQYTEIFITILYWTF